MLWKVVASGIKWITVHLRFPVAVLCRIPPCQHLDLIFLTYHTAVDRD
jgi:hypothetical protein